MNGSSGVCPPPPCAVARMRPQLEAYDFVFHDGVQRAFQSLRRSSTSQCCHRRGSLTLSLSRSLAFSLSLSLVLSLIAMLLLICPFPLFRSLAKQGTSNDRVLAFSLTHFHPQKQMAHFMSAQIPNHCGLNVSLSRFRGLGRHTLGTVSLRGGSKGCDLTNLATACILPWAKP